MNQNNTFIVAKEGWNYLGVVGALFVLFALFDCDFMQLVTLTLFVALAWVYRNPERMVPYYQEHSIVSVCDGTVTAIESLDECEFCEGPGFKIEITSGYIDASVLRTPFESEAGSILYRHGSRLSRFNPLSEKLNENVQLKFTSASAGESVMVRHMLEQSFDSLRVNALEGQKLKQGQRYGAMVKGVTWLYLPANSRVALNIGDTVRAGETLVGYFSTSEA